MKEHVKQLRSWKRTFDKDFNPAKPDYPPRYNLTIKQKNYLRRAWTWASTNILGMDHPCIPSAVPCYNEKQGFFFVEAIRPEWNHIEGVGETMRLWGQNNYNVPENLCPISRRSHTGGGMSMEDYENGEFVVHPDSFLAFKKYGQWKRDGADPKTNPITEVHKERADATGNGVAYHDPSYDTFFLDLAKRVITGYRLAFPNEKWPE